MLTLRTLALLFLMPLWAASGHAQPATNAEPATTTSINKPLVIGIKAAPPFVIREADGSYSGISVELWEQIAAAEGWDFRYEASDLEGLIEGASAGNFDAAIGAVTATAEREQRVDFSHPFYTTGLAIALRAEGAGWWALIKGLFTREFVGLLGGLALLLLVVGTAVWAVERRRNSDQFGGSPAAGIGAGFWWAAVTMTTVGYGDKAPATLPGRMLGIVWMFAALILVSSFTAAIASALTVGQLEGAVRGPQDLPNVSVAAVAGSTSARYLERERVAYQGVATVADAVALLKAGEVEAVVHDAPILKYLARSGESRRVRILPATFERQDYAIVLAPGTELREPVNRQLLAVLQSPVWREIRYRYLGE